MSILTKKRNRHVVPRWRSSLAAASSRDLNPLHPAKGASLLRPARVQVLESYNEFKEGQSIGTAADLLGVAMLSGNLKESAEAAQYILQHAAVAPSMLVEMATGALSGQLLPFLQTESADSRMVIARLRTLLRTNPRSATLWADLARHQASVGATAKAIKSMRVSLSLAPNHRWILRAANRLLLHAGEYSQAHDLIAKHPRTREDPWLMAAEIASAQLLRTTPRFLKQGRDILRGRRLPIVHISELATAIATTDLQNGSHKSAQRLLRMAIKDPTENALAQIEWAEREHGDGEALDPAVRRMPDAFEATCWVRLYEGRLLDAMKAGWEWLADEPFADAPLGVISHIAGLIDDYDTLLSATKEGLSRNPTSLLHLNNQAFAKMSTGNIEDEMELAKIAQFLIARMAANEEDIVHATANAGLLMYRLGRHEDGRDLYRKAISHAEQYEGRRVHAFAALYHLREAALARVSWLPETLEIARRQAIRLGDGAVQFFMRKLEDLVARPDHANEILGPATAARYLAKYSDQAAQLRVQHTETGPIVIVPTGLRLK